MEPKNIIEINNEILDNKKEDDSPKLTKNHLYITLEIEINSLESLLNDKKLSLIDSDKIFKLIFSIYCENKISLIKIQ